MTDRPNIYAGVAAICRKLELEPAFVRRLTISADTKTVTATLYEKNEQGMKYIRDDGRVATRRKTFKVQT